MKHIGYMNVICPKCKGAHLHNNRLCDGAGCKGTGFILVPITKKGTDQLIKNILGESHGRT